MWVSVHRSDAALVLLALACALATPRESAATSIRFEALDLPDTTPGEDLYRYEYSLSDFPHPAGYGFSIRFDPALYASLESPPPEVGPDWDLLSLQPDPGIPDDGLFDAQALVAAPATLAGFAITFVWLGPGAPGSQPFEIYDPTFSTIESGATVVVPEPTTLTLLAVGLTALSRARRKRSAVQIA